MSQHSEYPQGLPWPPPAPHTLLAPSAATQHLRDAKISQGVWASATVTHPLGIC